MFKKGKYLLILILFVIFISIVIVDAQQVSTATKADLVDSLEDLSEAMLKKIDCDIDITAQAFTDVKDYWRSKRWADIFAVPLRILQDTLSLLAKAADVKSLSKDVDAALNNSETLYQALSIVMMVQDLQKVGEKLYWGLNGPNYVVSIESMLEEADATFVPPFGDNWQKYYKETIENYLYGTAETIPLIITRRSATAERKNIEFAKGAIQVRSRITRTFNDLIKEIESKKLPDEFPIDEVIIQVKELKKQIHESMSYNTDVEYKTNFQDHVKVKLGAVGELYKAFGQVAGMVAKKLEIEQRVELLRFIESTKNAALLYTTTYKIPGAEEIKIAQKATILSELIINPYKNTFYSDSEKVFYMLPQEMILSMPTELSTLWMIADDIDQNIRCFYQKIATPVIITSPLKITSPPYYVGDTIDAEFTITNKESIPIAFSVLTVGGRDPDNQVADFTHRQNITLKPSESYDCKGTLTLNKVGDYHFFCTYQIPNGDWNTSIDLDSGLTDEDRVKDIIVKDKENQAEDPAVLGELFIEWDKTYGGSEDDCAEAIIQINGGYVVAGGTSSKGAGKGAAWVIKIDEQGNKIWDKTYGGSGHDWASSIIQTTDGGYVVAGGTSSKGAGKGDVWVIKLDGEGNKVWDRTYGGSGYDGAYSLIQTTDGSYVVAGRTESKGAGNGDAWVIKLDGEGNKAWDRTYGGSGYDGAYSLIQTTDGSYAVAGVTFSNSTGSWDAWVIKLDGEGNKVWDRTYGGSADDWASSIIQTTDGGYVVAGGTSSKGAGGADFWVIKLDGQGNQVWDRTYGGSADDWADSLIQTSEGSYVIAGRTKSKGAGKADIWVIKLNPKSIEALEEEVTAIEVATAPIITSTSSDINKTNIIHNLTKDTYYNIIQKALNDADSGDTIEVADGTYGGGATFPWNKKIILQSVNGASSTTIRYARIEESLEGTTLEGFTITGSGISVNSGNLIIKNCTISGNTGHNGGGIKNYAYGRLTITGSTISNNKAGARGGGIWNDGWLTITESTISNNHIGRKGEILNWGGGIWNTGRLTITGSTISNNYADHGGGIYNYKGSLTITGSTISNNFANHGGGIESLAPLTIVKSTISGNEGHYEGGGIDNSWHGTLTITGSTISNNFAERGGGIYIDSYAKITIGGNSTEEKNIICGNYKSGEHSSLDQQIRRPSRDLYETYRDTNYISAFCE